MTYKKEVVLLTRQGNLLGT